MNLEINIKKTQDSKFYIQSTINTVYELMQLISNSPVICIDDKGNEVKTRIEKVWIEAYKVWIKLSTNTKCVKLIIELGDTMKVKCIEKIEKISENVYEVHIIYDNDLRDAYHIEINVDLTKVANETILKIIKITKLIEEIANEIDKQIYNAKDVYIYPDNYEVKYSVDFDGLKIVKINHNTMWSDE